MIKSFLVTFLLFFSFGSVFGNPTQTDTTEPTQNQVECKTDSTGLCGTNFTINMSSISPGTTNNSGNDSKDTLNKSLGTIIQKLMIGLTMVALLIMTIGAGYMIMYHGQDEYLTKGKNIFMAGIFSLVVALSSYYLVSIITYIIY